MPQSEGDSSRGPFEIELQVLCSSDADLDGIPHLCFLLKAADCGRALIGTPLPSWQIQLWNPCAGQGGKGGKERGLTAVDWCSAFPDELQFAAVD